MRKRLVVIALSLFTLGCQKGARTPLIVEDSTVIVTSDNRTSEALGIETSRGVFTPLIRAGTKVPCSRTETFTAAENGQVQITIAMFRGNNSTTSGNTALGRFQVVGLPVGKAGATVAEITFSISSRQILVSARDRTRKTDLEIRKVAAGLNP
jgi:molecular chaperone DnaK